MWGGRGVAKSTMGIRKFNSRRSQVGQRKKIFPLQLCNEILGGPCPPPPQVMPMIPYTTKSKGVFLAISWYLALSEGNFMFHSVHGTIISHGWKFVITRIWNKGLRQSERYMFWGWQCKEASFWKRGHTGCYSSWAGRHPMWVQHIYCLRKVIRPVAFGQTVWTWTVCKSEQEYCSIDYFFP